MTVRDEQLDSIYRCNVISLHVSNSQVNHLNHLPFSSAIYAHAINKFSN